MRAIIDAVVDENSFFEMGRMYGRPIITGFARLDGVPVALMASDPYFFAGAWTADACRKIVRFVDMRSEEHTYELQSLMRISYAVFCLKKKTPKTVTTLHSGTL